MEQVVSVTDLTNYIKHRLEQDVKLQYLLVKGEISNLKKHQSGHWYFSLKDENSKINAVMFYSNNSRLKFKVEDGMSVVVTASINVYLANGSYQLIVRDIQPLGVGILYLKYEQLKKDLEKEGLFSRIYKKPIPAFPSRIVIITAPTGAAIRDIYTTITRRYKLCDLILIPSLVQGEQAADEIVKAINKASEFNPSVIILARGGGSIEDLWPFNEEKVARAIVNSKYPIITGIGHETDFTIADFASSLRAPTPTGAAELATPNLADLIIKIDDYKKRIIKANSRLLELKKDQLNQLISSPVLNRPEMIYASKRMHLDGLTMRFNETRRVFFKLLETKNVNIINSLKQLFKQRLVSLEKQQIELKHSLTQAYKQNYQQISHNLAKVITKLDILSPLKLMASGYALTYNDNDHIITSVNDVDIDDLIKVRFKDGNINAKVTTKEVHVNGKGNDI